MRRSPGTWAAFVVLTLIFGAAGLASAQGGRGGNVGTAAGALYGDLYVIERDGAGVPITRDVTYTDTETGSPVTVACVQPLAVDCSKLPLWAESEGFDPELYDPCAVYTPFVDQIQEVKFGRESVSRAPSTVIDKSYAEALKALNNAAASCGEANAIKLDPAGRLTLCAPSETLPVTYAWKTIDAPLENLGLYRAVMINGCFGTVTEEKVGEEGVRVVATSALDPTGIWHLTVAGLDHLICDYTEGTLPATLGAAESDEATCKVTPDPVGGTADAPCWWETANTPAPTTPGQYVEGEDMLSAAVFLAGGADKTSPVTLDEVVNVNNYLGVNLWTYTRVRKQQVLTISYFPFKDGSNWFKYTRGSDACRQGTTAALLTAPGVTPGSVPSTLSLDTALDVFGTSPPGVDLAAVGITVCRDGAPLQSNGLNVVCDAADDPEYANGVKGCGGANWFAQVAEDARKTIWYLHNWRVPEVAY